MLQQQIWTVSGATTCHDITASNFPHSLSLCSKGCLIISSIILMICGLLFTWCRAAKSLEMLMSARFFGGIASALIFTAQPMYLLELAPLSLSGSVGVFTCIGVTGGILLAQIVSMPQLLGNEENWPYALSFYALLVLVCLLPMLYFPESPRWLYLVKGDSTASELALRRVRGKQSINVQHELEALETALHSNDKSSSMWQVLSDKELLLPLLLVCSFQATQQLSGINAVGVPYCPGKDHTSLNCKLHFRFSSIPYPY